MKTNLTFTDFMVEASKNYLTEQLPTNYSEWSDKQLTEFLEASELFEFLEASELFELQDMTSDQVWGMIEACAEGFWRMYKESLPVMCN